MANKTPFTNGKNNFREGATAGGMFTKGTGGHTSRGHTPPPSNTAGSTSKANNRTGTLSKRMKGANGRNGMPR